MKSNIYTYFISINIYFMYSKYIFVPIKMYLNSTWAKKKHLSKFISYKCKLY